VRKKMKTTATEFWEEIAMQNDWPAIVYLRHVDQLEGFPRSIGGYRNLVCGKNADPADGVFYIGRNAVQKREGVIRTLSRHIPIRAKGEVQKMVECE
jgi:hypothetical protein